MQGQNDLGATVHAMLLACSGDSKALHVLSCDQQALESMGRSFLLLCEACRSYVGST